MKLMTPVAQDSLRKLYEDGVVLVLDTDQSIGPAVHRERELLAAAGIPPVSSPATCPEPSARTL